MATTPATIDLGTYSFQTGPEPVPEPERSWASWAGLRRLLPVGLLAVLLWPLAGAAAPAPPPLVPLWTAPDGSLSNDQVAVSGAHLYAVARTGGGPALTAYRLADGSVSWQVPLGVPDGPAWPSGPDRIAVGLADGVLVVQGFIGSGPVAVYDPVTADLRWAGEGYLDPFGAGLAELYHQAGDQLDSSMEIRELDSGAVVMSFEGTTEQFARQVAPDGTVALVGLAPDGQLASYDVASGTVRQRTSTPHQEELRAVRQNFVEIVGDLVLVHDDGGITAEVAAYDLATLEPLWTIEARSAGACGPVLCVHTGDLNGRPVELHGVDPVTGAPRWTMDCADAGVSGQCYLHQWRLTPGDRLVVQPHPTDPRPGDPFLHVIVDAATGRPVAGPTTWEIVPGDGPGLLLRRGEGVPSSGTEYWREEDITPHRVWWARSDRDLRRVELLGVAEADWCTPHMPYLVCHTAGEPFQVWRFSP